MRPIKANLFFIMIMASSLALSTVFSQATAIKTNEDDNNILTPLVTVIQTEESNETAVSLSLSNPAVPINGQVSVDVHLEHLDIPITAFQFDLRFDHNRLQLVSAETGSFLDGAGHEVICPQRANTAEGIRFACVQSGEGTRASGSGKLVTLQFSGIADGRTQISVANLKLVDSNTPPHFVEAAVDTTTLLVGIESFYIFLPHLSTQSVVERSMGETTSIIPAYHPPNEPSKVRFAPETRAGTGTCYEIDFNCDTDINTADLSLIASVWNCTAGDACFISRYDLDGNRIIDARDLAWTSNEFDITPPEIKITTPVHNGILASNQVVITGTLSDTHTVVSVAANDTPLTIDGQSFTGSITAPSGNQTLYVVATDEVGKMVTSELVIAIDGAGPDIVISEPANRQAVYTLTPTVTLGYDDFYDDVDPGSLHVTVTDQNGHTADITHNIVASETNAQGVVGFPLTADTIYTLTAVIADTYGHDSIATSTFYVPTDPENIIQPVETADSGYVSGQVFASPECDDDLHGCASLSGAQVTLVRVTDMGDLADLREMRQTAAISANGQIDPLATESNDAFTTVIEGTMITGPDGFFSFPVSETGHYWVFVEKDGYTDSQREVEIVRHHSATIYDVYLTPIDTVVTLCDTTGCEHTSSDGRIKIDIPAGAIEPGDLLTTTATIFDQVEFLPSGELPPGTWETYAFDLSGGRDQITFTRPVTVQIANTHGFDPGTEIPLGYWNEKTLAWEHAGTAVVDATGEWVVMQVSHFSKYDCNDPLAPPEDANAEGADESGDDEPEDGCSEASAEACIINLKTGHFSEEIELPYVTILGDPETVKLIYDTSSVMPSEVIDIKLSTDVGQNTTVGSHLGFELFIEGESIDQFTFEATLANGEVGRYRYLWDGTNSQGKQLPSGIYEYQVRFSIPYRSQYCYALDGIFGNPPDCKDGATGRFIDGEDYVWVEGTVELDVQQGSPYGDGLRVKEMQTLYENEAGEILITNGLQKSEFYFPTKNILLESYTVVTAVIPTIEILDLPQDTRSPQRTNTATTTICGELTSDTVWTKANSPYLATCTITVPLSTTLTIEPGVIVQFADLTTSLIVSGTLNAIGTANEMISFQPDTETTAGSWSQIRFITESVGVLDYSIVEYGGASQGSLWIGSHDVTVSNSIIQYSANTGIYIELAHPTIANSEIRYNKAITYGGGLLSNHGNPTIESNHIHANSAFRGGGVYINGASDAILRNNIFFKNSVSGSTSRGGAVLITLTDGILIEGNRFEENWTSGSPSNGGAIRGTDNDESNLIIQNNHFESNAANGSNRGYGGAISGHGIVLNNVFLNNTASRGAGAIHGGLMLVEGNLFEGNSSVLGGALYIGSSTIQNNIIVNNDAEVGGAIWTARNNGLVMNNTIYNNQANSGSAIYMNYSDSPLFRNNIITNNRGGRAFNGFAPSAGDVAYNNVWNNTGGNYGFSTPPLDISADPLFVDAANGDFHLEDNSPMIDAGDPEYFPKTDWDDNLRYTGGAPDMGVDEFGNNYTPISRTAADYSKLLWDSASNTYTRLYLDRTIVHFNTDGSHDYTLEPDGRKTNYTYNSDGSVNTIAITAPSETTPHWLWQFTYADGQLATITDPANRVTTFELDRHNHLRSVAFPDQARQQFVYDQNGLMTHYIDEEGAITSHFFDDYGRIRQVIEPARIVFDPTTGQNNSIRETLVFTPSDTAYPLINDSILGSTAEPAPAVLRTADLQDVVQYGRGQTSGQTNRWGGWLTKTDELNRTTERQYDERNNITLDVMPDGDCVTFTYDEYGNRLSKRQFEAAQCDADSRNVSNTPSQDRVYTYESTFNYLKTETDPRGNTTTYIYDYEEGVGTAGNLIRVILPPVANEFGVTVTPTLSYTYNEWNLLETETDARGSVTRYIYTTGDTEETSTGNTPLFKPNTSPVPGYLTQIIQDDGGLDLTITYRDFDGAGNPGTIIPPGGVNTQTVTYDDMNRVLTVTDAEGKVVSYVYDGRGDRISQTVDYTADGTTGRNVVTLFSYDDDNQLVFESTAADGLVVQTQYLYDINRKLARQIDSRGHTTDYIYDDADQLIHQTDPAGHIITRTYGLDGQLETETDADGYVTRYIYDGLDRLTSRIVDDGGLNQTTHYQYDLNNNVVVMTDTIGVATCHDYDSHNRRVATIQDCGGLNLRTQTAYDVNGNPVYKTDERGVITAVIYDALNRPILTRIDDGGLNLENSITYNAAGNRASESDERGIITSYFYDDLNRQTRACEDSSGLNLCTTVTYDRLNNRTTNTDPNGITILTNYNAFSQPVEVTADADGLQATTRYSYDNTLNLVTITDDNGNSTRYTYTERNELASEQYADGTIVSYQYDGRGNRQTLTNQDSDTITHTYDGGGRLQVKTFSTGGSQTFDYDLMNRMTRAGEMMHGHTSKLTFMYDPLGNMTQTSQSLNGAAHQVGYAYDYIAGQNSITYPSGETIIRTIDPLRRLATVQRADNSTIATYAYADLDSYYTLAYENGTTNRTEYDPLRRITRISSEVGDYRYGYDGAGNRVYMQRAHKAGTPADLYEYDGLYQLTQVWYGADALTPATMTAFNSQQFYELDTLGNRLSVTEDGTAESYGPQENGQLANPMNRYESVDGSPFRYDLRGNTLTDGQNIYTYDLLNRQIGMTNSEHTAEYIYDALGRRIAKVVDGVTTHFIYDNNYQVMEELDGDYVLEARYVYGRGIDEPLVMQRNNKLYFYHRDVLSSVTGITDERGILLESYEYDVFGDLAIYNTNSNKIRSSILNNNYQFTSQRYDSESQNYYYRNRIYSTQTGRFLQVDPLGYIDGLSLYFYAQNNPTTWNDPLGLQALDSTNNQKKKSDTINNSQAEEIFKDMADEKDIPFAYPADGCYERAADMSERINQRHALNKDNIKKAFIIGNLQVDSPYIYSTQSKENGQTQSEMTYYWGYHVAPAILVQKDKQQEYMIIDPSIMDGPATIAEWKTKMNDPNAQIQIRDFNAYTPNTNIGDPYQDGTVRDMGNTLVNGYLELCKTQGYCK